MPASDNEIVDVNNILHERASLMQAQHQSNPHNVDQADVATAKSLVVQTANELAARRIGITDDRDEEVRLGVPCRQAITNTSNALNAFDPGGELNVEDRRGVLESFKQQRAPDENGFYSPFKPGLLTTEAIYRKDIPQILRNVSGKDFNATTFAQQQDGFERLPGNREGQALGTAVNQMEATINQDISNNANQLAQTTSGAERTVRLDELNTQLGGRPRDETLDRILPEDQFPRDASNNRTRSIEDDTNPRPLQQARNDEFDAQLDPGRGEARGI